jgi:hypothetical protein
MRYLRNTVRSGRVVLGGAFESLYRAMADEQSPDAKLVKLSETPGLTKL